jgi:hypothetical protein
MLPAMGRWYPYSEIEFKEAEKPTDNEIEQARRDFVRWRLSLGGR